MHHMHVWAGEGGALCTTCMCGQVRGEHYAPHACSMLAAPCAAGLVPATNLECYLYVALCTNPTIGRLQIKNHPQATELYLLFPAVTGMPSIRTQSAGKDVKGTGRFHSIFHHRNWRAKVSCDVDINQSAGSMVM